jgi:chromosome partitioning protein
MLQAPVEVTPSPHVIVVGNEKGGSGKTTIAMHLAVALMKAGQRVATLDLDGRQRSLTRYVENRRRWALRTRTALELPAHVCLPRGEGARLDEVEAAEFAAFEHAVAAVQQHDFLVIDTPPHDSYLMRLAHAVTDTLVTPLNDSFLDLDVLAAVDPLTYTVTGISHYAEMVREARRNRRQVDGMDCDWVVIRNRLSVLGSRNKRLVAAGLNDLSARIGFRWAEGLAERVVYRELFPRGLTALDDPHSVTTGLEPDPFCANARAEVAALLDALKLPLNDRGKRRAIARAQWFAARAAPLETDDVVAAADAEADA